MDRPKLRQAVQTHSGKDIEAEQGLKAGHERGRDRQNPECGEGMQKTQAGEGRNSAADGPGRVGHPSQDLGEGAWSVHRQPRPGHRLESAQAGGLSSVHRQHCQRRISGVIHTHEGKPIRHADGCA